MERTRGIVNVLRLLRKQYGDVALREPRTPFELILWENVGYLVDDERRDLVFHALKREVGLKPVEILSATPDGLAHVVRDGGMQPRHRAEKLRRCAEIALSLADGDLAAALKIAPQTRRRTLLKKFPGIGDPGADKILLLCGYASIPALESNGLRVMQRLGFVAEDPSYARMYNAATAALGHGGFDFVEAFALFREHGRELCKRSNPVCPACSLKTICPSAP